LQQPCCLGVLLGGEKVMVWKNRWGRHRERERVTSICVHIMCSSRIYAKIVV
jgi:hypothetical protein